MTETLTTPEPVVTPTKREALKTAKAAKPRPNLHVKPNGKRAKAKHLPPKRGKLIETLSPSELKAEIIQLLDDLEASNDPEEKKRIRRSLRVRGHVGGLGKVKAKK